MSTSIVKIILSRIMLNNALSPRLVDVVKIYFDSTSDCDCYLGLPSNHYTIEVGIKLFLTLA